MEIQVSENQWQEVAKLTNLSVDEVKSKYEAAIAQQGGEHFTVTYPEMLMANALENGEDIEIPFEIGFYKILAIKGKLAYRHNGGDWSVELTCGIYLLGNEIKTFSYTFNKHHTSICIGVSVGLAKAKICFGITGNRLCFKVNGEACYWAVTWRCESFDETIVCLA